MQDLSNLLLFTNRKSNRDFCWYSTGDFEWFWTAQWPLFCVVLPIFVGRITSKVNVDLYSAPSWTRL